MVAMPHVLLIGNCFCITIDFSYVFAAVFSCVFFIYHIAIII